MNLLKYLPMLCLTLSESAIGSLVTFYNTSEIYLTKSKQMDSLTLYNLSLAAAISFYLNDKISCGDVEAGYLGALITITIEKFILVVTLMIKTLQHAYHPEDEPVPLADTGFITTFLFLMSFYVIVALPLYFLYILLKLINCIRFSREI